MDMDIKNFKLMQKWNFVTNDYWEMNYTTIDIVEVSEQPQDWGFFGSGDSLWIF